MDASTTVLHAARFLAGRENLTIITNSIRVAEQMRGQQHRVYLTGGLLLENSDGFAGPLAELCVRQFNADVLLFSSAGVSRKGMISDYSEEETQLRRVMLSCARRRIFLCDSSKIGRNCLYNLGDVTQADEVLCEREIPEEWKKRRENQTC